MEKSQKDQDLIAKIVQSVDSNDLVETKLKTDDRVIARVTDGIYRQPGSALRELINNAYDADATEVIVKTDAPRFGRISVEDNGHGMTPEVLAHMLLHIGGSAKRNNIGQSLGISSSFNANLSPNGRELIGKIGIGIFSVAQLTHQFQIITKTKGDSFRTIASVALKQYSDNDNFDEHDELESGKVIVWREKANDIDSHGTSIILTNIRPQARGVLQSREVWSAIVASEEEIENGELPLEPPKYNIGMVGSDDGPLKLLKNGTTTSLPWLPNDSPKLAFKKFVDSVWLEFNSYNPNPKLDKLFDNYLKMLWNLSLSIPLSYVDEHIFDTKQDGWAYSYLISNEPKKAPLEIPLNSTASFRQLLGLEAEEKGYNFEVYIDSLQLARPIKFKNLPLSHHQLRKPILFLGKCLQTFDKYAQELSGGPLSFEAYLFWTPKLAPTEHRGALVRIHGASGTLFDESFMRYQVAELTRLRQISCEIFIKEGFDSALNIDRESFNQAHPHAVFLSRWLHNALKQLTNTEKKLSAAVRHIAREELRSEFSDRITKIASDVWQREMRDTNSSPPQVEVKSAADLNFDSEPDIVVNVPELLKKNFPLNSSTRSNLISEKMKGITQVLASFGLLENLTSQDQDRLFSAILQILDVSE